MRRIINALEKKAPVTGLNYDPKLVKAGIAHIGVGNFHRAHQAYYTHQYLNLTGNKNWGIVGIGITASGKRMAEKFEQQKNLYTLTTYAADGSSQFSVVGAITKYIAASVHPQAAIEQLASPDIRIVTLTITEGGYYLNENNEFNYDDLQIQHDLANPTEPKTAFGYIVEALRRRKEGGIGPFTVLSCDNLLHNGDVARQSVISFAKKRDGELAQWIADYVTFPNAVVDRITPATEKEDFERLNIGSGIRDEIPVFAEDFTQWIIEDNFCAGRPGWELAGVIFTEDVTPYEHLKLRFLNASHSMLAYPAFLAGYRRVDKALRNKTLKAYLEDFMNKDVSPVTGIPAGIDLEGYKKRLLSRFSNAAVSDKISRLCFHGGAKIPAFILPTLKDMLQKKMDLRRVAFLIASYGHYLKQGMDDLSGRYEVDAPALNADDWRLIRENDHHRFLHISPLASARLYSLPGFVETYTLYRKHLLVNGTLKTLQQINFQII
ncbi:mannitol dehydrogenase family protein [Mucilaginibacter sp.]|jgi:mannitol 2-dehydrogenase|uniref:mannitol dehydrogenase family protein n=1 Tax=Mucilaginibacter sp. TaxID=1882438 RepID=UPI0035620C53